MSVEDFKPENWSISSNDALKVSIVDSKQDAALQFAPTFTYPIFGDEETIFGFRDLVIHLVFDSMTFKPFVNLKHGGKMPGNTTSEEEILGKLIDFLPRDDIVVKDEMQWDGICSKERETFELPDDEKYKINEYTVGDETFAIYKVPLNADASLGQLHRRIQIFSILFIEAATYIKEDEPDWEVFWLFNKNTKNCIGYVTTYKYWNYGGFKEFDKPAAERHYRGKISQFIILPPYQSKGHGAKLYNSVYENWNRDKHIVELTVEDPSESFDDLRDRNDLTMLNRVGFFDEVRVHCKAQGSGIDSEWLQGTRSHYKIEERQFSRVAEMILLQLKLTEAYRYQVKRRLYIKNYEALTEMPTDEDRTAAITKSLDSLTEDYHRILDHCHLE